MCKRREDRLSKEDMGSTGVGEDGGRGDRAQQESMMTVVVVGIVRFQRELGLELEHNGEHMTDFIANSRTRHQKDRDAKAEALKIMGSSSSLVYASAEEHALSNERKRKSCKIYKQGQSPESTGRNGKP